MSPAHYHAAIAMMRSATTALPPGYARDSIEIIEVSIDALRQGDLETGRMGCLWVDEYQATHGYRRVFADAIRFIDSLILLESETLDM